MGTVEYYISTYKNDFSSFWLCLLKVAQNILLVRNFSPNWHQFFPRKTQDNFNIDIQKIAQIRK